MRFRISFLTSSPLGRLAIVLLALASAGQAAIFSDDFNDANITGWSTYNPLSSFGGSFTVSYPQSGKVQLQTGIAPNFPNLGPGRGVIYRNDLPQTGAHVVAADFSTYEINNQFFGVVARMGQIGLGALDAYTLSYSPQWYSNFPRARFAIDRLDNEQRTELIELRFDELPYDGNYRLELMLQGSQLTGVLRDLQDPLNPLSTLTATDNTYSSGVTGLFVVGSLVNNSTSLANFDNYSIQAIPEPSTWSLLFAASCFGVVAVRKRGQKYSG